MQKVSKIITGLVLFILVATQFYGYGEEEVDPRYLPSDVFLAMTREPFRQNSWGKFIGIIQHKSETVDNARQHIHVSILFGEHEMRCQVILNRLSTYTLSQQYREKKPPITNIELPPNTGITTLQDLGIKLQDLGFSFIYWTLVKEDDMDEVRGRECRVFRLENPNTGEQMKAWISVKYLFPLKAVWFKEDMQTIDRTLEFTDFRQENDLWYVQTFRLEGDNWKTRIRFVDAKLHHIEDTPIPDDLFQKPNQVQ